MFINKLLLFGAVDVLGVVVKFKGIVTDAVIDVPGVIGVVEAGVFVFPSISPKKLGLVSLFLSKDKAFGFLGFY